MDKKRKGILGLATRAFERIYFTHEEKHQILQELFSSGMTKQQIWEKYTGKREEHGHLLRWMRQLGYDVSTKTKRSNFEGKTAEVARKKKPEHQPVEDFETLQLKKRIEELEGQLKDAEMKAIAFSTMVDIAEKEFNIPIRKKYNTKPWKK